MRQAAHSLRAFWSFCVLLRQTPVVTRVGRSSLSNRGLERDSWSDLKKPTHGTGGRRLTTEAHNDPPRPPNNVGDCYRGGGIDDGAACASVECGSRLVDVRNLGVAAPIEVKCEM